MIDESVQVIAPGNKDSFFLRFVSAAVLAPLAIIASYFGGPIFVGLVSFLCVLMAFEWSRMIESAELTPLFFALGLGGAAALVLAAGEQYAIAYAFCVVSGLAAALVSRGGAATWPWAFFAAPYILAPSVALIWLRESAQSGQGLVLLLFAIVWAADTGGYLGGRLIGGPRLSPAISPAKTWAGAVGGVVAGAFSASFAAPLIFDTGLQLGYIVIGASLGLVSIVGDMVESAIKRSFRIKDMSGFVPGHGGVLDRLDGMIFVTTAVTAALYGHSLLPGS